MRFLVDIECETDAFGQTAPQAEAEVSWILADLARKVGNGEMRNRIGRTQHHNVRDTNGNTVGTVTFAYDADEDRRPDNA